ncbi:MAG: hypothetical protein ACTFAK_13010 [Candidatus Electronema sp. VV]
MQHEVAESGIAQPLRERGTGGVGLAIVKTCVESCGDSISAGNRQPKSLSVWITLKK